MTVAHRVALHRHAPQAAPRRGRADAAGLEAALRQTVDGEVRFDAGSRALYATTGSNYRQVPIGVVVPRTMEALVGSLEVCRRFGVPVLPRGGGTSLAGQSCNVAVVIDASKHLTRILDVDPDRRLARVQPGVVLDRLRDAAAPHHLTFGPDPSTHAYCTLGGMIGNNSCGVHSVSAGRTADNVEALEVVTGDGVRLRVGATSDDELERRIRGGGRTGEIYAGLKRLRDRFGDLIRARYPRIPRRVSGYGLDQLLPEHGFHVARALAGTEGTCVTILEATVRLVPEPRSRALLVLGFPDVFAAADAVPALLPFGPHGLEGLDDRLLDDMRRQRLHEETRGVLPEGGGWLLVEFGGETPEAARERAEDARAGVAGDGVTSKVVVAPERQHGVWLIRESGLGATAHVPGEPLTWEGWEDAAVPPDRLGPYLRDFHALLRRFNHRGDLYGHFGDGCVHTRIDFDFRTPDGRRAYRRFLDAAADLVVRYGGSFSGEHGDGLARSALLPKMFGPALVQAFEEFKRLWDPDGRMNPGRKVSPDEPDAHLRLGRQYAPAQPDTHFGYAEDGGDFSRALLRCVGVGACRKTEAGTMCPSYMVTRDEQHSTRGRSRLLFEMLQGDVVTGGWRDEHVKDALGLCLSCKGCKGECPVRVDMATYKAEFLAHYYEGRLRPRHAYAFGFVAWWARLGSLVPWTARLLTQRPATAALLKRLADVAPDRRIPALAPETFRARFRRRTRPPQARPRVVLWPDTFNDHFHPDTAEAAVDVLERLGGYRVDLPRDAFCCGRPLYDYGMLGTARRWLVHTLGVLEPDIDAGTPIVVLEPSCASVFRDELLNLFPDDHRATRLASQVTTLAELIDRESSRFDLPRMQGRAMLHGHCHHKALADMDPDARVLRRLGLETTVLDAGCCGMAGAFGFESEHAEVSRQVGERRLLPAVRGAARDTLVVADGFSCREQIAQEGGRRALHLADVLRIAMRGAAVPDAIAMRAGPARGLPGARETAILAAGAAGIVAAAAGIATAARRGRDRG